MSGSVPAQNESELLRIVRGVRDLFEGRSNAYGTFTLAAGETETTVIAPNCGETSEIVFSPKTADAAGEVAGGAMYVSSVSLGSFTVAHANDASTERTFAYRIVG